MGGMMSAPVPVPDERMLQMIAKLKRKRCHLIDPRALVRLGLTFVSGMPPHWLIAVTDSDLRVLFSKFTKYDQEVRLDATTTSVAVLASLTRLCFDGLCCELQSVYRYFSKGVAWFMKICCLMPSLPWHSKSGTIDRSEFYKSIDEKHSEFGDAVFALIGGFDCR